MTQNQPSPPETPPPAKGKGFAAFLAGVVVGFGVMAGVVMGPGWTMEELGWMLLTPFGVVPIGLLVAIPRSTRSFGLGLAASAPIGLLVLFAVCGIAAVH